MPARPASTARNASNTTTQLARADLADGQLQPLHHGYLDAPAPQAVGLLACAGDRVVLRLVSRSALRQRTLPRASAESITAGTNGVLGICYNPAPGDPLGPRGDLAYSNLVSGFNTAVALSDMSLANVFKENTLIYRTAAFTSPNSSNMDLENTKVMLP